MEAKAIYKFDATNSDELTFKEGDELLIMDKHTDDNWFVAEHANDPDRKGVVPSNYIKMPPHDWYKGKITRKDAEKYLLGLNFDEENFLLRTSESTPGDFSMSIKFADKIQHFKVLRDGTGKFFLWVVKFPSINKLIQYHKQASVSRTETIILKEKAEGSQQQQQQRPVKKTLEKVTCLYDFTPDDDDELTFSKGDILEVLEKEVQESWSKGRNTRTGQTGLFPCNYVR
ncbi:growth factor receptor-bound protein 2-like [Argopecten irradians]|uniref:growth factor receptor-bound protein 2-like n=1 Tax=Argopecten irradians TaxID=31199 RepID=UPI0037199E1D